jgi:hypothetical protein
MGRMMVLQSAALHGWVLEVADAKSAFQHAGQTEKGRQLYTYGVSELRTALKVTEEELIRILGAVYGVTNAPRIFWKDADSKLVNQVGMVANPLEQCIWTLMVDGVAQGMVCSHVDDFILVGNHQCPQWMQARERIGKMYRWSPWKSGAMMITGVWHEQRKDFSIVLSQETYSNQLEPIHIEAEKARNPELKLDEKEKSQFRSVLMKCQWRCTQTGPHFASRVSLLTSCTNTAQVSHVKELNSIVREMKKASRDQLVLHAFNAGRPTPLTWNELVMITWTDAAKVHERGGIIIAFAPPEIETGKESKVAIFDWRTCAAR